MKRYSPLPKPSAGPELRTLAVLLVALAALVLPGLASCSGGTPVLYVSSTLPEVQILTELYQEDHQGLLIQILNQDDPKHHLTDNDPVDVVIDRELNNPNFYRHLADLSDQSELLRSQVPRLYPFSMVQDGKRIPLVMLSFDLPGILGTESGNSRDSAESLVLDLGDLARNSKDNSAKTDARLSSLYFSPLASQTFALLVCQGMGARFSTDRQGYPSWNHEALDSGILSLRTWSTQSAGGPAQESAFLDRYGYIPVPSLVASGRLKAAYMDASEYFALPPKVRDGTSFRYLSINGKTFVLGNAVYGGISTKAKDPEAARQFLSWIIDPKTQERYLARIHDTGMGSFGFLGSFSTLRYVNEKLVPLLNQSSQGMIPPETQLAAPDPVPFCWSRYMDSILGPYLVKSITSDKDPVPGELQEQTMRWYLQQGFDVSY